MGALSARQWGCQAWLLLSESSSRASPQAGIFQSNRRLLSGASWLCNAISRDRGQAARCMLWALPCRHALQPPGPAAHPRHQHRRNAQLQAGPHGYDKLKAFRMLLVPRDFSMFFMLLLLWAFGCRCFCLSTYTGSPACTQALACGANLGDVHWGAQATTASAVSEWPRKLQLCAATDKIIAMVFIAGMMSQGQILLVDAICTVVALHCINAVVRDVWFKTKEIVTCALKAVLCMWWGGTHSKE